MGMFMPVRRPRGIKTRSLSSEASAALAPVDPPPKFWTTESWKVVVLIVLIALWLLGEIRRQRQLIVTNA
jgi:hypothetical protein